MMTIHESFTSKIGIISYLTALKNRSNENGCYRYIVPNGTRERERKYGSNWIEDVFGK